MKNITPTMPNATHFDAVPSFTGPSSGAVHLD